MKDQITLDRIKFSNAYQVYGLKMDDDEKIRYIGITSKNIQVRINEHLKDLSRTNVKTHKKNWIVSCMNLGKQIGYIILEDNLTQEEAFKKEIEYIKLFKSFGANLVNGTLGGDGVRVTNDVRMKFKQRKGFRHTKETREKMSIMRKGKKLSDETKRRMSESQKRAGNKPIITDEIRKKKSERMKGMTSLMKGKKHSESTKKKISLSKFGHKSARRTRVVQLDKNNNLVKEFESLTQAIIETKINNISRAIKNNKIAGGYFWKHKNTKHER